MHSDASLVRPHNHRAIGADTRCVAIGKRHPAEARYSNPENPSEGLIKSVWRSRVLECTRNLDLRADAQRQKLAQWIERTRKIVALAPEQ
jgi:hypothetical protein